MKRKAYIANPVILGILVLIISLAFLSSFGLLSIGGGPVVGSVDYAGYNWKTEKSAVSLYDKSFYSPISDIADVYVDGNNLIIEAKPIPKNDARFYVYSCAILEGAGSQDEFLIMYDNANFAAGSGGSTSIYFGEAGIADDSILNDVNVRDIDDFRVCYTNFCTVFDSWKSFKGTSISTDTLFLKLINNFDGTWSTQEYQSIGDVWFETSRQTVKPTDDLRICAIQSQTQQDQASGNLAWGTATIRIINIVTKEDEVAKCKIDETLYSKGQELPDGTIAQSDVCVDIPSIIIANEDAIEESLEEEIIRESERLEDKEDYIEELEQATTNEERNEVLAKVIQAVSKQDKPESFFTRIINWFKNLFKNITWT